MIFNTKPRPKQASARAKIEINTLVYKLQACNQSEVAKSIGYDQSQVSRAVNGKLTPSRDFGQAIATHFNTTLDQVLAACEILGKAHKKPKGRVVREDDKRLGPRKPKLKPEPAKKTGKKGKK